MVINFRYPQQFYILLGLAPKIPSSQIFDVFCTVVVVVVVVVVVMVVLVLMMCMGLEIYTTGR
jgi:uncharacterized membrane protein YdbT with pleckstrin-like domain